MAYPVAYPVESYAEQRRMARRKGDAAKTGTPLARRQITNGR